MGGGLLCCVVCVCSFLLFGWCCEWERGDCVWARQWGMVCYLFVRVLCGWCLRWVEGEWTVRDGLFVLCAFVCVMGGWKGGGCMRVYMYMCVYYMCIHTYICTISPPTLLPHIQRLITTTRRRNHAPRTRPRRAPDRKGAGAERGRASRSVHYIV